MKKILFIANYHYLNFPTYEKIVAKLKGIIDPNYVGFDDGRVSNIGIDFSNDYYADRGFKRIIIKLKNVKRGKIINLILSSWHLILNFSILHAVLKTERPDTIVVGSDLGNLNVRFLIERAQQLGINIIILYLCDIPTNNSNRGRNWIYHALNHSKIVYLRFIRAILFEGDLVGTYSLNSKIFVISEDIKTKLISQGIASDRIYLYNYSIASQLNRDDLLLLHGISKNKKVVSFYTECLQEVYGIEYAKEIYKSLGDLFNEHSMDNVVFIIRPHPLEPSSILDLLEEIFSAEKFIISRAMPLEEVILLSDINIAHYSRVLIEACIMEKIILSINFRNDRERSFILDDEVTYLEANNIDGLKRRIMDLLYDAENCMLTKQAVKRAAKRFCSNGDDSQLYFEISGKATIQ